MLFNVLIGVVTETDTVNAAVFYDWVTHGWPQIEFLPAYEEGQLNLLCLLVCI